jgi:hypothetical protein
MAIWQDLVSDHGFPGGYETVKRFVRKLRGSELPEAVGIASSLRLEKKPRSITVRVQWCGIRLSSPGWLSSHSGSR